MDTNSTATITAALPFDLDAEKSVLGAVMLDNECITSIIELITPEDFYDPRNREVYGGMLQLFDLGKPIDFVTMLSQLKQQGVFDTVVTLEYMVEVTNAVPTSANAAHYAAIIADNSIRRQLIDAASEISALSIAGEDEAVKLLDMSAQKIFDVARKRGTSFVPIDELLKENYAALCRLAEGKQEMTGLPTGFSYLDLMLSGLKRGSLTLIAARPSMGKSSFALNIATNIALQSKASIAMFSLEMSTSEVGNRILSSVSMIKGEKFKTGKIAPQEWNDLVQTMSSMSDTRIYTDDSSSPTVLDIRAKCRRLKMDRGLDLVIIDHILLMQGTRKTENRQLEIAEISRALKILAKDLDIAVIAVSQLNRAADSRMNKRPILSDLRDSGAIEQDADVVLLLYRDDYYNPDTEFPGVAECIVAKNRNGETGTVRLAWNKEITRFESMDNSFEEH